MNAPLKSKPQKERLIINRLAIILKEQRISNKDLAERLGYEQATISKWATNTIQPPITTFLRIALEINRDLKDFFISTEHVEQNDRKKLLKELAAIGEQGKRTGKS